MYQHPYDLRTFGLEDTCTHVNLRENVMTGHGIM